MGQDSRITQKYLRRYPDSKRTRSWAGVMVHIETENGVWREGGSGYTYAGRPEAWVLPFEEAQRQVDHCGPEKRAAFIRLSATVLPDGLDVVAWHWEGRARDHAFPVWAWQKERPATAPEDVIALTDFDQAQSALSAMAAKLETAERNRDAGRDNFHTMQQSAAKLAAHVQRLTEENEELRDLAERLKLEAQGHASEAKTANSTIYEIYQVLSGGKGEPGNWRGAEPARKYVETAEARIKALEKALTGLEFSCDVLASTRSAETYRRMVDVDKASEALSALDAARSAARSTLNSREKADG